MDSEATHQGERSESDIAYPYHNGSSEIVVGKTLKDECLETVQLGTKMPVRMLGDRKDLHDLSWTT